MKSSYKCELCEKRCRLMDFNYSSDNKYEICRCNSENALIVFKLKGCKIIHKLGIKNTDTNEYIVL